MIDPGLLTFLDDIKSRIDPQVEDRLTKEWVEFNESGSPSPIFTPSRARSIPSKIVWPRIWVNDALQDSRQMVLQQFKGVSNLLSTAGGNLLDVRCNYGSSILPSLFGVEMFIMDRQLDTLPTSRPLYTLEEIHRLLDRGVPPPTGGWGERTLQMGEVFAEIALKYPKIKRYVTIYHPDVQGPMDVCEVVWGSTIFYALYDCPEVVKALLELVTQTYIRFLHAWEEIVPFHAAYNSHWGFLYKGNIMLRDDSAMNLSQVMFDEFIAPYDQRLLDEFGGGAIHFCGKGDHYIESMGRLRGLSAINLSQPYLNDMSKIYQNTIDRGIRLLALERSAAENALASGINMHGYAHIG